MNRRKLTEIAQRIEERSPVPMRVPPSRTATQMRLTFVAKYLVAGYSLAKISTQWNKHCIEKGIPEQQVSAHVIRGDRATVMRDLSNRYTEDLHHYRGLLIERYEMVVESLHPMVRNGNLGATDRYLKTLQQLGDITGSNAPIKLEVENTTNLSEEERQRRVMAIITEAKRRREENGGVDEALVIDADDDDVIDMDVDLRLLPGETSREHD